MFFQPPTVTMAPDGNIWFHPAGHLAGTGLADDLSKAPRNVRAHFVHELTHVWQYQNGVNVILEKVLMFFQYGAFGGYGYELIPGRPFDSYNIEQQACIVADAYLARCGEKDFPHPDGLTIPGVSGRLWGMKALVASILLAPLLHAAEKPRNVVFFLVDDLGVKDIDIDGSDPFYETPNLAKFAKTAVNFTNGYASCPVCSPTRSAIMTGQNPTRTHHTDYFGAPNQYKDAVASDYKPSKAQMRKFADFPVWPAPYVNNLAHSHTTLPEALKNEGYATFFAGKWHLGSEGFLPTDHGFDINKGGLDKGGPYGGDKYFSPYVNPYLENGPKGVTESGGQAHFCCQKSSQR